MTNALLIGLAAAVLVLLLIYRVVLTQQKRRVRQHAGRGRRAEAEGLRLLERAGWRVVAEQPMAELVVEVDGRAEAFGVRADVLVERAGERRVAEIKGGEESASLATRATRRQLLEYARAFGGDEVLLVDVPARRIHRVRFPARASGG